MDYLITGLMRSRTTWFSAVMTDRESFCYHEAIKYCDTIEDYEKLPRSRYTGNSDSTAIFFLDELVGMFPNMKIVLIKRNYKDALESLNRFITSEHNETLMKIMVRLIESLDTTNMLVIPYRDIDKRFQEIYEYCIPQKYDEKRFKLFRGMNIQPNNFAYHHIGKLANDTVGSLLWL